MTPRLATLSYFCHAVHCGKAVGGLWLWLLGLAAVRPSAVSHVTSRVHEAGANAPRGYAAIPGNTQAPGPGQPPVRALASSPQWRRMLPACVGLAPRRSLLRPVKAWLVLSCSAWRCGLLSTMRDAIPARAFPSL